MVHLFVIEEDNKNHPNTVVFTTIEVDDNKIDEEYFNVGITREEVIQNLSKAYNIPVENVHLKCIGD